MTHAEWETLGKSLFGDDMLTWRFVCPSCGNVQTAKEFTDRNLDPNLAYFNCLGRHDGKGDTNKIFSGKRPCNYTSGGLFDLRPIEVVREGEVVKTFAFETNDKKD
jgi:hypothetical protein